MEPDEAAPRSNDVRYMLTVYADEQEWMALPTAERDAAIGEIGGCFAKQARAGKIVEGHRLAPLAD